MAPRRIAIGTTTITLVIIIVIIVGAMGFFSLASQPSTSKPSNSSSNSSVITPTNNTASTICIVPVEGAGVFLHIVSDSTQQPVPGIAVQVIPTATSCFGVSRPGPADYTTNTTGWISIDVNNLQANYYFLVSLENGGRSYNFSLPQGPLDTTNATLSLPSGNLSITLCYTMATANPCRPYTESTTTNTTTYTSVLTSTVTASATSTVTSTYVSQSDLQLQVRLNATTLRAGGAITAEITVFNPVDENDSIVPAYQADSTIQVWNGYNGLFCGSSPVWSLAGYALFEGHYTTANLSSAGTPLTLYPPLIIECPAWTNPSRVVFLPDSSSAVAYFPQGNQTTIQANTPVVMRQAAVNAATNTCIYQSGYYNCGGSTSLFGYWTQSLLPLLNPENATISSQYFHYFSPGRYTLVVEDMWGQASYSYFEVAS